MTDGELVAYNLGQQMAREHKVAHVGGTRASEIPALSVTLGDEGSLVALDGRAMLHWMRRGASAWRVHNG